MAPKKKLTKKEKQRLESEKAEASRLEQEKERQRQLEEEREQKRLERVDAERRQKQEVEENKIRKVQLKESCDFFEKIQNDVNVIYAKLRKKREWKIYMRCNGLPNTYDPGDIRKYIHMWLLDNKRSNEAEQNWLLSTNEMSILTQDHRVVNMTRSHLKELQHNLGDQFSKRTNEVLGILKEIDEAILDTNHLSKAIRTDLKNLKYIFRTTLSEYIDEFSYKILSNIDRDMDLEGLSLARHKYESNVFKIQLWTLREAPLPPLNPKEQEKADRSHTEISFSLIGADITLPPSVKMMNTAVRLLWLNYDHFSDYAPSFNIPVSLGNNSILYDISKAARKEWQKRKEILQTYLLQNESPKKNEKDSTESIGVVDVDTIYENYEKEQAELALKQKGPEALGLKEFDINMRRHRIVAGIYYVEHLEQPQQDTQLQAKKFLRTLSYPNHLRRIGFHQTYKPPPPVLPGVRRLPEEIEAEMREVEANLDRLGSVNIKLPEDVIWFEPPVVCRWESYEESKISEQNGSLDKESEVCQPSPVSTQEDIVVIEDFNLLDVPAGLDLFTMLKEFVVPRMPNGYIVKMGDREVPSTKSFKDMQKLQIVEQTKNPCIKDSLVLTNSPRPLFPSVEINHELQILDRPASPDEENSEDSNDKRVYMFSTLLRDLDEICELQVPYPDALLDEITENFDEEEEQEEEVEPEQEYMGISFMRADLSWSMGRKEEEVADTMQQTEDFNSDSELEDNENESTMNFQNEKNIVNIGKWSSRDVHDVKFNEEKLSIQFKFGRMGAFGLAINWYNNLPFQGWELKPDAKDPDFVIFNLSGAVISIEVFVISEGFILNSYQGGLSSIVQDILGKTLSFDKLKDALFRAAINLFPENDAFCYTEGTCEKNSVLEHHAYTCMAAVALTHNFAWSRWNMLSGRRSCVMLMRETIENRKLPPYSTLLLTPQKATIVDCTDVSPAFNPKPIEGLNFYADLHHLAQDKSTPLSLEKHASMDTLLRQNINTILKATRPLSFC